MKMLRDILSAEFSPGSHLLNLLRILHCETKKSDKCIPGKILSPEIFKVLLSILYTDAKKVLKTSKIAKSEHKLVIFLGSFAFPFIDLRSL